jgi:hypothetical protein
MKKTRILLVVFLLVGFGFDAFSQCPTNVIYKSSDTSLTFNYSGAIPTGFPGVYDELRLTISSGAGSGNSYLLPISFLTKKTIHTGNASVLNSTSVISKIEYYLDGVLATSLTTCNTPKPLPVKLIKFTGEKQEQVVILNWVTATEINNKVFEIERKLDSFSGFKKIGEVEGSGNSNQTKFYNFIDKSPITGAKYYRLKQIDYNGEFEYSPVISIIELGSKIELIAYPNPVVSGQNLVLNLLNEDYEESLIEIYSQKGEKVLSQKSEQRIQQIHTEKLTKGTYTVVYTNPQGFCIYKIIFVL